MRITTWNIRAGGGKRTQHIAQAILDERPHVIVLTEFRPIPGRALIELLSEFAFSVFSCMPDGKHNSVCILSKSVIELCEAVTVPKSIHRWVSAVVPAYDLTILGVHVPNQSEAWNKREFWDCIETFAMTMVYSRCLIIGDLNTALDEDCQGEPIREAVNLKRLLEAGWVDSWRQCNPCSNEFSWFSHRANGFRLDHCLVSPLLGPMIGGAKLNHEVRVTGLSDHSMLTVDIDDA